MGCGKPFGIFDNRHLGWIWIGFDIGSLLLSGMIYAMVAMSVEPRKIPLQPEDLYKYAYRHKDHQIIEDWLIILVSFLSMMIVVPFLLSLKFIKKWDWRSVKHDALLFVLAYLNGLVLQIAIVEVLKRSLAIPRPDFLHRCFGDYQAVLSYIPTHARGEPVYCSDESSKLVSDGRLSFPSGHSSAAGFSYSFLGLFIFQRLSPYGQLGYVRFLLPIILFTFALFIMASRVVDNRHHAVDAVTGGIIGTSIGIGTYRFYYAFKLLPLVTPYARVSQKPVSSQEIFNHSFSNPHTFSNDQIETTV